MAIYRYVTEQSFDAYMWQALETKARFIAQLMKGDHAGRTAQDIGGQELSYAEVKAIASGNPAVLTLAETDAELQRLSVLKKNHADEQYLTRRRLRELPGTIERLSRHLSALTQDMATAQAHAGDAITIGSRSVSPDDAADQLAARLDALPKFVAQPQRFALGVYQGLQFGLVLDPSFAPELYLHGAATRQEKLSRLHHGPRAVLNALDRLAGSYETDCAAVRRDLSVAEGQLRDYQARLGAPFPYDDYLRQLTALRDQLKAGLSGTTPDLPSPDGSGTARPDSDNPASASDPLRQRDSVARLAEQITSLRAAHSIEAPAERTAGRRADAEEPVTARIRRRAEALSERAWQRKLTAEANAGRAMELG